MLSPPCGQQKHFKLFWKRNQCKLGLTIASFFKTAPPKQDPQALAHHGNNLPDKIATHASLQKTF
jgi:hypothetical protein